MNTRHFHLSLIFWLVMLVPLAWAESFPNRPTVAEMDQIVVLGTECINGVNERCYATQYANDPEDYRVYPPFVRTDPAIGWRLDTNALGQIAETSRTLVPWYVDPATVYNGSSNIIMLTVTGVWANLEIGDYRDKFTATFASATNAATYDDYPPLVRSAHLVERYKALYALEATKLAVDIFQRKHGSDYSGKSNWLVAISSAENSYLANKGGRGPYGTWDTYSVSTWLAGNGTYEPTVVRVVTGGVTVVFSTRITNNLAMITFYMSATNYTGGEIGENNSVFDNNGLRGLTDDWVWNRVKRFYGPFQTGQQVLFLNNSAIPKRCIDPKFNIPPGSLRGYVTKSPRGEQRIPLAIGDWQFNYCILPLW